MDIVTDFFYSLNQMWEKAVGADGAIELIENILSSIINLLLFMFTAFWLNVVPQFINLIKFFVFFIQNMVLFIVLIEIFIMGKCIYDDWNPIKVLENFFVLNLKLVNWIFVKMMSIIKFVIDLFRAGTPTK